MCGKTLRVVRHTHNGPTTSSSLPRQARVVVCGGGIAGLSVAYHLAKFGWKEILILEQGR